jgi:hypothetical protein
MTNWGQTDAGYRIRQLPGALDYSTSTIFFQEADMIELIILAVVVAVVVFALRPPKQ